jgi:hypothetical protein
MTSAGWMRFRARRWAMRRISWIDQRMRSDVLRLCFFGRRLVGLMLDGSHHGEGEHDERDVTMTAVPGSGFVVVEPNSFLAVSKLSSIAKRWPSTLTSVLIDVPAGHQVVKLARSPLAILRRISRPRVQRTWL